MSEMDASARGESRPHRGAATRTRPGRGVAISPPRGRPLWHKALAVLRSCHSVARTVRGEMVGIHFGIALQSAKEIQTLGVYQVDQNVGIGDNDPCRVRGRHGLRLWRSSLTTCPVSMIRSNVI
jgi:hypothetical protein